MTGIALVFIIMTISLSVTILFKPEKAFLNVYLPVLLMTPVAYKIKIGPFPDIHLDQAALLPIIPFFLFYRILYWRFSFMDLLVLAYVLSYSLSDYISDSLWQAQNTFIKAITQVFLPYILAKALIEPLNLGVAFAKRFVVCLFIDALAMVLELISGKNPFLQIFWQFFPGETFGYGPPRFGFNRVYGPFKHSILAGMVLVIAHRLNRWLQMCKALPWRSYPLNSALSKIYHLVTLTIPKGRLFGFFLILAMLFTFSRGPWLGALVGAFVFSIALSKNVKRSLIVKGFCGVVLLYVLYLFIENYTAFTPYSQPGGDLEGSAIYRSKLWGEYEPFILEKPWWGWGITQMPMFEAMPSIDNYYLYLTLLHGIMTLFFFVALLLILWVRLVKKGISKNLTDKRRMLAFTFLGIFSAIFIVLGTVYIDDQISEILFILVGWSESFLISREPPSDVSKNLNLKTSNANLLL